MSVYAAQARAPAPAPARFGGATAPPLPAMNGSPRGSLSASLSHHGHPLQGVFCDSERELLMEKARYQAHRRRMFEKHSKGGGPAGKRRDKRAEMTALRVAIPYRGPPVAYYTWDDVPEADTAHIAGAGDALRDRGSLAGRGICIALPSADEGRSARDAPPPSTGAAPPPAASSASPPVFTSSYHTSTVIAEAVALRANPRFEHLYTTARVAGEHVDTLVRHCTPIKDGPLDRDDLPTWVDVPHAVVLYRGHMFKFDCWDPKLDKPVHPNQVRKILEGVVRDAAGQHPLPLALLSAKRREDVAALMGPSLTGGEFAGSSSSPRPPEPWEPKVHQVHWRERRVVEATHDIIQTAALVVSLSDDRPRSKGDVLALAAGLATDKWYGKGVQLVCFANDTAAVHLDPVIASVGVATAYAAALHDATAQRMKDAVDCGRLWHFLRTLEHETDNRWTCFDLRLFEKELCGHPAFRSREALAGFPLMTYRRLLLADRLSPWVKTLKDPYDAGTVWFYNPARRHGIYHKDSGFIDPLRGRPSEWLWEPACTELPQATHTEHPSVLKDLYLFKASAKATLEDEADISVVKFEEIGLEMMKRRRVHPDTFIAFALSYACFSLHCGERDVAHSHMFVSSVSGAPAEAFRYAGTASEMSESTVAWGLPGARSPVALTHYTELVSPETTPATTMLSADDATTALASGLQRPQTAGTAMSGFTDHTGEGAAEDAGGIGEGVTLADAHAASGSASTTTATTTTTAAASAAAAAAGGGRPKTAGGGDLSTRPHALCGILRPSSTAAAAGGGARAPAGPSSLQLMFAAEPITVSPLDETLVLSDTIRALEPPRATTSPLSPSAADRDCPAMFSSTATAAMCRSLYHGAVGVHPSKRNAFRAASRPVAAFLKAPPPRGTAADPVGRVYLSTTGLAPDCATSVGALLAPRVGEHAEVRASFKALPNHVEVALAAPPAVLKPLVVHIRAAIRTLRDIMPEKKRRVLAK